MIECINCGRKLFNMQDVLNVRTVGFYVLYGNCKHCSIRQPVNLLWKKTKVQKYVEIQEERKPRKKRLQKD